MATVTTRRKPESAPEQPATLADLLRQLGNIPARRVRLHPAPGTATERDVLLNHRSLPSSLQDNIPCGDSVFA